MAGAKISGQGAHEGRGPVDRGEYRQVAGAITEAVMAAKPVF